jgi:hypothetical protein
MTQTFHIPAHHPRERTLARISMVLAHLSKDAAWDVEVHEHKAKRSDSQNRYLWGVVYPAILAAGGNTLAGWRADDLHEYLLGEHFGWEVMSGFGKKRQRPVKRSSKLSTVEFMDFIAFIQQRMAEHGIYVPDPNEVAA